MTIAKAMTIPHQKKGSVLTTGLRPCDFDPRQNVFDQLDDCITQDLVVARLVVGRRGAKPLVVLLVRDLAVEPHLDLAAIGSGDVERKRLCQQAVVVGFGERQGFVYIVFDRGRKRDDVTDDLAAGEEIVIHQHLALAANGGGNAREGGENEAGLNNRPHRQELLVGVNEGDLGVGDGIGHGVCLSGLGFRQVVAQSCRDLTGFAECLQVFFDHHGPHIREVIGHIPKGGIVIVVFAKKIRLVRKMDVLTTPPVGCIHGERSERVFVEKCITDLDGAVVNVSAFGPFVAHGNAVLHERILMAAPHDDRRVVAPTLGRRAVGQHVHNLKAFDALLAQPLAIKHGCAFGIVSLGDKRLHEAILS